MPCRRAWGRCRIQFRPRYGTPARLTGRVHEGDGQHCLTSCLVQFKIARDGPRLASSYVARWDVIVSSGPHDAAPAATADIRATYWIGMTYS